MPIGHAIGYILFFTLMWALSLFPIALFIIVAVYSRRRGRELAGLGEDDRERYQRAVRQARLPLVILAVGLLIGGLPFIGEPLLLAVYSLPWVAINIFRIADPTIAISAAVPILLFVSSLVWATKWLHRRWLREVAASAEAAVRGPAPR